MTEEDFRARLKLRGYRTSTIDELVEYADEASKEMIFSFENCLQSLFDRVRSEGMERTLKAIRGKT